MLLVSGHQYVALRLHKYLIRYFKIHPVRTTSPDEIGSSNLLSRDPRFFFLPFGLAVHYNIPPLARKRSDQAVVSFFFF